jgi:UDP-GlcNAc:undecaprenyl-phosphate GlcNAc-1-phosphate transferase
VREYVLVLLVAAAVTYLLTPLARWGAVAVRAMSPVRDRDVHATPTPRLGGLAMYGGVLAALVVASRLPHLDETFRQSSEPVAVLKAGALICLIGALDDRFELDSLTKLAGQIVAAGVLVLEGVQLLWIPLPRYSTLSLSQGTAVIATVLFIVLTINAVNFVDGLDGLAAGVVGIASFAFFAYSYQLSVVHGFERAQPPTLLTAVLAGACLGFLPHNFDPARVFMGDSGAMLLGLVLAASVITLTGQLDPNAVSQQDLFPALMPLLLPLLVLAVPFVDLVAAVVRRSWAGQSPFTPDKRHIHHRLLEIGHSTRRAVLIMYGWSALLALGAIGLSTADGPVVIVSVTGGLVLAAVAMSLLPKWRATFGVGRR